MGRVQKFLGKGLINYLYQASYQVVSRNFLPLTTTAEAIPEGSQEAELVDQESGEASWQTVSLI